MIFVLELASFGSCSISKNCSAAEQQRRYKRHDARFSRGGRIRTIPNCVSNASTIGVRISSKLHTQRLFRPGFKSGKDPSAGCSKPVTKSKVAFQEILKQELNTGVIRKSCEMVLF